MTYLFYYLLIYFLLHLIVFNCVLYNVFIFYCILCTHMDFLSEINIIYMCVCMCNYIYELKLLLSVVE